MDDLATVIINNGIGVVCVAYMIYFQNTTMREMLSTLNNINVRLATIEHDIHEVKEDEVRTD